MVTLHITIIFLCLGTSLAWFKSPLHPHFLFSVALTNILVLPYAVTGDAHRLIPVIATPERHYYQIYLLMAYIGVLLLTALYAKSKPLHISFQALMPRPSGGQRAAILMASVGLLALEIGKRFVATDWSLTEVIDYSLGPRFQRPWSQDSAIGGSKHFYFLIELTVPLAGIGFAYLATAARRHGWVYFTLMLATLLALATEGTRAPVVFILGSWLILFFVFKKSIYKRIAATAVAATMIAVLTTTMVQNRDRGLSQIISPTKGVSLSLLKAKYHQDDSNYWALYAMHYYQKTNITLNKAQFFAAALVNPVPRAIWPNKPYLGLHYWLGYKPFWITSSVFGEMIALFGTGLGLVIATIICLLAYTLLHQTAQLTSKPFGIALYLAIALYVYMIMRSFPSITQVIYLPAAVYLVLKVFVWRRRTKTVSSSPYFNPPLSRHKRPHDSGIP